MVRAATMLCQLDVVLDRREMPKINALRFADSAKPSASAHCSSAPISSNS